ncbi:MAG: M20 family metallopeptidase [Microbacterium sp.]
MTAQSLRDHVRNDVQGRRDALIEMSHRIHANPETAFNEVRASGWLTDALGDAGFTVERGIAGLDTAFRATAGSGPLHIVICAEYDALPAIGHACGHNIIAASALGAGVALAPLADQLGITMTVMGTPAEEGGAGKIIMLERGAFDGAHAAMMIHPSPTEIVEMPMVAASHFTVRYHGKPAHAAGFPEAGINAADAMVIAQTAIGLRRQQMRPTEKVHGIVTKGGDAPNIIPAETEGWFITRALTADRLADFSESIERCFQAGALATGAKLEIFPTTEPYAHVVHDQIMADAYARALDEIGRDYVRRAVDPTSTGGSTDMGNVSLKIPTIHPSIGIDSLPAVNHQPEFAAACITPAADRAVVDGATAMALTVIDLATDDNARAALLGRAG